MEAWKCKLKRKLRVSSCWSQGGGPNRVKPLPWITWMIRECSCIFLRNKAQEWISNEVFCIFLELIREEILLRQIIFVRWCFGPGSAVPLIFNLQFYDVFSLSATLKGTATVDRKSGHRCMEFWAFSRLHQALQLYFTLFHCLTWAWKKVSLLRSEHTSSDYRPRLFDWWTLKRSVDRLSATWLYATRSGRSRNFRMTKILAEIQSELLFQCRIGIRPTNAGFEFHC